MNAARRELCLALGGALFAVGWLAAPLTACGVQKITYDLALWRSFRRRQV